VTVGAQWGLLACVWILADFAPAATFLIRVVCFDRFDDHIDRDGREFSVWAATSFNGMYSDLVVGRVDVVEGRFVPG
jgi:hypothetical protein